MIHGKLRFFKYSEINCIVKLTVPYAEHTAPCIAKCGAWPETGWPVGSSQALEFEFSLSHCVYLFRSLFLGSP